MKLCVKKRIALMQQKVNIKVAKMQKKGYNREYRKKGDKTMNIGGKIKTFRKQKKISVDFLAKELGVSKTTIYRYEDETIEKIPLQIIDKLCEIFEVSPAEFMGNSIKEEKQVELPSKFQDAQEAMEFMLKIPMVAAYGGYDPEHMSPETIVEFSNEILQQLKLVSYKYKNTEK